MPAVLVRRGVCHCRCGFNCLGRVPESAVGRARWSIESSLFAPAVYFLRQIPRENLKLRLLELPLSSAKTADEAAQALIKLFAADFGENQRHNKKGKDATSQALRQ
jgi:hypothetical protein